MGVAPGQVRVVEALTGLHWTDDEASRGRDRCVTQSSAQVVDHRTFPGSTSARNLRRSGAAVYPAFCPGLIRRSDARDWSDQPRVAAGASYCRRVAVADWFDGSAWNTDAVRLAAAEYVSRTDPSPVAPPVVTEPVFVRDEDSGVRLRPPASPSVVAEFEEQAGAVLVHDHRSFLTTVADGGPGPSGIVLPVESVFATANTPGFGDPRLPFLLTGSGMTRRAQPTRTTSSRHASTVSCT